jgi:radical SAM superfamily enzyme YgiQ (UPF0313 family)
MQVLLVITNLEGYHEVPYSFGLGSIGAWARAQGHQVEIAAIRGPEELAAFPERLAESRPQVVGFSAVSSQFGPTRKAAALVKQWNPEAVTVCGGVHPTLHPQALLSAPELDYFFRGESEQAFAEFLERLASGREVRETPNLCWREGAELGCNPLNPRLQDLSGLPAPLKGELFEDYIRANRSAPFFFSRGCPYACTYCSNTSLAKVYGKKRNQPRFRPVESCIQEIVDAGKEHGFDKVFIMDDIFGLDAGWRSEFLRQYRQRVAKPFICLLRVNLMDEEFGRQLKEAGCRRVMFGVESGNEHVRNRIMNRGISTRQIREAFGICREQGIETLAINIIGLPGETEEMIQDTVRLNREIRPTQSAVNIFYPYKGTPLGDQCFAEGLVDEEMYSDFANERQRSVLRFSPEFRERLEHYHRNWPELVGCAQAKPTGPPPAGGLRGWLRRVRARLSA